MDEAFEGPFDERHPDLVAKGVVINPTEGAALIEVYGTDLRGAKVWMQIHLNSHTVVKVGQ